jgi:anaerobic nitric oxide reductase flavorubredoxin
VAKTDIPMEIFDAARTHSSYILPSLWTKNGVLIGAPTYEVSLFPPVSHVLEMANHKRIKNRRAAYFGSYGWSGGAYKDCVKLTEPLEWEWVDALEVQGRPSREDLHRAEDLGERFARLIAEG